MTMSSAAQTLVEIPIRWCEIVFSVGWGCKVLGILFQH